jgi:hypothetical protein
MKEQWLRWQPLEQLYANYCLDTMVDSDMGLTIELSPYTPYEEATKRHRIRIFFEGVVFGYRITDKEKRSKTICYLTDHYGADFYKEWTFFAVENSTYKEWMSTEYYGSWDKVGTVKQYTVMCDHSIIDIITMHEPIVNYIESYSE